VQKTYSATTIQQNAKNDKNREGANALNTESIKLDHFATKEVQNDITQQLTRQKYTSHQYEKHTFRKATHLKTKNYKNNYYMGH